MWETVHLFGFYYKKLGSISAAQHFWPFRCVISCIYSSSGNTDFMHDFFINRVKLLFMRKTDKLRYLKCAFTFHLHNIRWSFCILTRYWRWIILDCSDVVVTLSTDHDIVGARNEIFDIWYVCLLQLGWHPVAAVQYTFTHKQCTEQHNETEYHERNTHNSKNT